MAQYLLSVMEPTGGTPDPELLRQVMRDVEELDQAMRDKGVWVFAGGLHAPTSATVLRAQDGRVVVTDGPFAEGKEHLGGFSIIDVDDLDAALDWGSRLATATGLPIEVRPFRS
ncbi:YciI family protein [Cellulomonas sp.]|uniref:YciI family protein n=1 Tax=Cellulomonas sp. TaxID=40001 RepID=UPI001B1E33D5|nr:YciI family protein [Cellulomonas sp.]MBO9556561.1 hypothetical protein [Cellulomonas sp.]